MWQDYVYPESIGDALALLAEGSGQARIIAGGTDLVLQLRKGERQAISLVDISRIGELRKISREDGIVNVGAAATHADVASSPLIQSVAPVLAEAAKEVGSPEIRNAATIGGNVVNAQPAADSALALLVLGAEVEVIGSGGARWVPLLDLYAGAGVSTVDSTAEIVCNFRFEAPPGHTGSAYRRLGKCKSIALPVLCAATMVQLDKSEIASAAIGLGPVAPLPFRPRETEGWLAGKPATLETARKAAAMAQEEAQPRDSLLRCSREYREAMVGVLVQSTLEQAIAASSETPGDGS